MYLFPELVSSFTMSAQDSKTDSDMLLKLSKYCIRNKRKHDLSHGVLFDCVTGETSFFVENSVPVLTKNLNIKFGDYYEVEPDIWLGDKGLWGYDALEYKIGKDQKKKYILVNRLENPKFTVRQLVEKGLFIELTKEEMFKSVFEYGTKPTMWNGTYKNIKAEEFHLLDKKAYIML